MMLSLFVILLCISLLKLQHFTTLCKMRNASHMQLITETDVCISLTFTCLPFPPQGMKTLKKPKPAAALYHQTAKSINFVFLFFSFFLTIIKLERKKVGWKLVCLWFPCHHVISMRNICATAKWPAHKTPTLSDVLFSIPLRQNQNNRPAANKNKITFPISIPDREKLQEKRLGKEPERKSFHPSTLRSPAETNSAHFSAFHDWW